MTKDESIKILAVLKTAYPNGYKSTNEEEIIGIINLWCSQFSDIPYWLVSMAVNNCISSSKYPPSIFEVKEKIKGLYFQAQDMFNYHHKALRIKENPALDPFKIETMAKELDENKLKVVKAIIDICTPIYKNGLNNEKTLDELITGFNGELLHNTNLIT